MNLKKVKKKTIFLSEHVWGGVLSTIIGGIILSFLFFIASDFIFKPPDLSGKWFFAIKTTKTKFNKYQDLEIFFTVFLVQEGLKIYGTGEKVMERLDGEIVRYPAKSRIQIKINGYIDRKYLSKDSLILHYDEEGSLRKSSSFQKLIRYNDKHMTGKFESTIAESSGLCDWDREIVSINFIKK